MRNPIIALALFSAAGLGACAGLPADGPSTGAVMNGGEANALRVEQLTLATAGQWPTAFRRPEAHSGPPAPSPDATRIQAGDRLNVTIYEGMDDGVFGTSAQGGTTFEEVLVSPDGAVQLPYVGALPAAGRSISDLRLAIISRVRRFAVRPEVLVSVSSRNMGTVSVGGAVQEPGRFTIGEEAVTLLDALSLAGAPLDAPYSSTVLIRDGRGVRTTTLADIAYGPSTPLREDTEIIVIGESATFQALGAVRQPGSQPITTPDLTLLQALGSVGGLDGLRANPRGVFVFRGPPPGDPDPRPRVYQLNMREPEAFAIAQSFPILPGDALFVTEAPVSQWTKVLSAIQGTVAVGASAATVERLAGN